MLVQSLLVPFRPRSSRFQEELELLRCHYRLASTYEGTTSLGRIKAKPRLTLGTLPDHFPFFLNRRHLHLPSYTPTNFHNIVSSGSTCISPRVIDPAWFSDPSVLNALSITRSLSICLSRSIGKRCFANDRVDAPGSSVGSRDVLSFSSEVSDDDPRDCMLRFGMWNTVVDDALLHSPRVSL